MISLLRSDRQFNSTKWTSPGGPLFTAPAAQPLRRTGRAPTSATVSAEAADTGGAPPLGEPPHLCGSRPGAAGHRPTPRGPAAGDGRGPDARDHRGGAGSRAPGKGRSHVSSADDGTGVGPNTALRFVAALDAIGRFPTAHKVEAYLGLVPGEQSSSQKQRRTGITKAGSPALRHTLVQAAWAAQRCRRTDPLCNTGPARC